jgi:hypothetical protein
MPSPLAARAATVLVSLCRHTGDIVIPGAAPLFLNTHVPDVPLAQRERSPLSEDSLLVR